MVKLAIQQIGKCGELLVQYMLLKHGVESAPLTTDPGIDLVALDGAITMRSTCPYTGFGHIDGSPFVLIKKE